MAGVDSVISLAFKLTGPIRKKAMNALGINPAGKPGRSGDGIVVGRDRVKIEKKINQLKGGGKALGAAAIIHELLGINTVADGSIRKDGDNYKFVPVKPKAKVKPKSDPRKDKQITLPKRKPKKPKSKVTPPKPKPKPKPKKKQNGVKFVFETNKKGK
jgi:outer membrane biosynthesis protein TonB